MTAPPRLLLLVTLLAAAAGGAAADVQLGPNASLRGKRPFPDDNVWNTDISAVPVDPASERYLAPLANTPLHPDFTIPYVVVAGTTVRVPVLFKYWDESDRVLYPIPPDPPIERGDRHILIIDRDNWKLYELAGASRRGALWTAEAGAAWDLARNDARPAGWTSADAAGLPIFPGLVRYDEVAEQKQIRHALRFTVRETRRAYVFPASHWASKQTDPALMPMGARLRLKASVDLTRFPPEAQVILRALRRYGMILADNGGDLFISGAPDARWDEPALETLKLLKGRDFEVILTGNIVAP